MDSRYLFMVVITNLLLAVAIPSNASPKTTIQQLTPVSQQTSQEVAIAAAQTHNPHWHSYTPRQRAIATAVAQIAATYYTQTAQPLPVTPETVALVVQSIEAYPSEVVFVCDRMYAQALIHVSPYEADVILQQTHQHLHEPTSMCTQELHI